MIPAPDVGLLIGMSVVLMRDDLETAAATIRDLGFEAIEVHLEHVGPGMAGVPIFERHAEAAGELVRRHGLRVGTLNAVADRTFDPFGGPDPFDGTARAIAAQLRLTAAMGSPRLLIHEGRIAETDDVPRDSDTLTRCLERARQLSGLIDPPPISVECHPFTWALAHRRLPELARALAPVGAGICLDLCHFAVALGPGFISEIDHEVLAAINHVHFADSDARTSELHFPPGLGVLDLEAIARVLAGRGLAIGWDLFGWPGPRGAIRATMPAYAAFIDACRAAV
ncbi:MAG: sugar phosphate isomerase/epimerase family protein [Candidatus Limnocylindrales bacterium]